MRQTPSLLVLKIGSSLIADSAQQLRREWMASLAADIAALHHQGTRVLVVSSGAVALGRGVLGLGTGALSLGEKQAAAATGQPLLMQHWQTAFAPHQLHTAQMLLTLEDSENRTRYLNARETCTRLLAHGLIPIVNENDTVATAELRVGDNDRLAARVAAMVGADALVLLSDVAGLYTKHPREAGAVLLRDIAEITPEIFGMAAGAASAISSGGMRTKLEAARIATAAGCTTYIASGLENHPLAALNAGGEHTCFRASKSPQLARKHWILSTLQVRGRITIDAGAARALEAGKSLLPAGVVKVEGVFEEGDTVSICAADGHELARGLIAYDSAEAARIAGKHSREIASVLGYDGKETLIHRDDLAMLSA